MAHVYGHCDFFKNNYWFSQTNRKMIDEMANHGNRIRRYMDRFGVEEVEDVHRRLPEHRRPDRHPFAVRSAASNGATATTFRERRAEEANESRAGHRFRAKDYMDPFINPAEVMRPKQSMKNERSSQQAAISRPSRRAT